MKVLMKRVLTVALAIIIGFSGIIGSSYVLVASDPSRTSVWMDEFNDEPEETIDAVFIGGSNVFAFFQGVLAWHEKGITVWNYTCESQRMPETEYMIRDARKRQPDALYIIAVNGIGREIDQSIIHFLTDNMRMSSNKISVIERMCSIGGYEGFDKLEFYIPFIRYHDRWKYIRKRDFHHRYFGVKGANVRRGFLTRCKDESNKYSPTDDKGVLSDVEKNSMNELMDYLEENHIKTVFVATPQLVDKREISAYNAALSLAKDRGFDTLNLYHHMDDMQLDPSTDYYNMPHTNIHGSIKVTEYIANYLVNKYGFKDKRGNKKYKSWDDAYDIYKMNYASKGIPEELLSFSDRDYSIVSPGKVEISENTNSFTLSWAKSKKASGYSLYRKIAKGRYNLIKEADSDTLKYEDSNIEKDTKYNYIVVPYKTKGSKRFYGSYYVKGTSKYSYISQEQEE